MKYKFISIISIVFVLAGCAATPPAREVELPSQSLTQPLSNEAQVKLVIFNSSNALMYGLDGSGKINIHLNGEGVGQLKIGQYVLIGLERGEHTIDLLHKDLINFSSSHKVAVSDTDTYLKIYAKVTSNGVEIVQKPDNFDSEYKPAY